MDHLVSPSLLAADFLNLGSEISMVNKSLADWIHCDIMDGVFVPNISIGLSSTLTDTCHVSAMPEQIC
jgi:ribulose-phosphate 3-epimerase